MSELSPFFRPARRRRRAVQSAADARARPPRPRHRAAASGAPVHRRPRRL